MHGRSSLALPRIITPGTCSARTADRRILYKRAKKASRPTSPRPVLSFTAGNVDVPSGARCTPGCHVGADSLPSRSRRRRRLIGQSREVQATLGDLAMTLGAGCVKQSHFFS